MNEYTPKHAAKLDAGLEKVSVADVRNATAEIKLLALQSLVQALDSGLKIAYEHYVDGRGEPYPGSASVVMRQCREAITVARKTGLIPERR